LKKKIKHDQIFFVFVFERKYDHTWCHIILKSRTCYSAGQGKTKTSSCEGYKFLVRGMLQFL